MGKHRKWPFVIGGILLLTISGAVYLDHLVTLALREITANIEQHGFKIEFGNVRVRPIARHLSIKDLSVMPDPDFPGADSSMRFTFRADELELVDVALLPLIREKRLHVQGLRVEGPRMDHFFRSLKRKTDDAQTATRKSGNAAIGLIEVDTVMILNAQLSSQEIGKEQDRISVEGMDLLLGQLSLHMDPERGMIPHLERSRLRLRKVQAGLEPFYTLTIDSLQLDRPGLLTHIHGFHMIPDATPDNYHERVEHQVELYRIDAKKLELDGFDLLRRLREGLIAVDVVRVKELVLDIHRDKSIPMGPQHRKPLFSEAILASNAPLSIDSVVLEGAQVRYSERMNRGDAYGTIAFTGIDAVVLGLSNLPVDEPYDLHVNGTCQLDGQGQVELDVRMPMTVTGSPFESRCTVKGLHANVLNRMTDNLIHVDVTDGLIHSVDLHMHGNDHAASGTLDMRYEDLKLLLTGQVKHHKILGSVANLVIRGNNMPDKPGYRTGAFSVQRDPHKSFFSYLWDAMKHGMFDIMLPGAVNRKMEGGRKKHGHKGK